MVIQQLFQACHVGFPVHSSESSLPDLVKLVVNSSGYILLQPTSVWRLQLEYALIVFHSQTDIVGINCLINYCDEVQILLPVIVNVTGNYGIQQKGFDDTPNTTLEIEDNDVRLFFLGIIHP